MSYLHLSIREKLVPRKLRRVRYYNGVYDNIMFVIEYVGSFIHED